MNANSISKNAPAPVSARMRARSALRTLLRRSALLCLLVVLGATLVFALGVAWPAASLPALRAHAPIAIVNVSVVDVRSGTMRPGRTVLLDDGRIRTIGGDGEVALPASAIRVEGTGKFLIPGLWDMHTHVLAVTPLLDLPLYIAYGVTNVRDMQGCPTPDDPFVACADQKRQWTEDALSGKRVGPRIAGSTSWMANGPGVVKRLGTVPEYFDTATPEQARTFVRHFAGTVGAIKVYDRIPRDAYFALVDEARRQRMDVVGHRPRAVSAIEAAACQKSIEHARFILHESFTGSGELRRSGPAWREDRRRMLDEHAPRLAAAIFEAMKRNGTWYVPTHLTRWSDAYADSPVVRKDPNLRYLHPLLERQWLEDLDEVVAESPSPADRATHRDFYRKGLELTGAAHRAGVKVLAGTDYIVAGVDLHRELLQLAAAGLSPAEVLRAATLSPAEYFGLDTQYGTVETGKVADLVLLNGNPLVDVRNTQRIEAVIFNGNLYDRAALDRIVRHVERQARSWTVACKIIWRFVKNPGGY
jgi:imidazolonepropionase-like amidohydrolase